MPQCPSGKRIRRRKPGQRRDLSSDRIIASALELIDAMGARAFSMRVLAGKIGVTPMALYNHFSDRRSLLAAVAAHVIGSARFDSDHADWRDRVRHCFDALRTVCLEHPGLPGVLELEGVAPAAVFTPMEITVRALKEAGLDDLGSLQTYFLLVNFTIAQAAYQTRGPIPDLEPSHAIRTKRIVGRGYAATERLQMPKTWDFDAAFAFGMQVVLSGVEAITSNRRSARTGKRSKHSSRRRRTGRQSR